MAKVTSGGVTIELTPAEAKALHAVLGGMSSTEGIMSDETDAVFNALDDAGINSDHLSVCWDADNECAYLKEVR